MRFYIASRLENAAAVIALADRLKAAGHEHTYDWAVHGRVFKEAATYEANVDAMQTVALAETKGVVSADVVIVMLPGGKGTHVELGMALALGKPVLLVSAGDPYYGTEGDSFPCAFWYHRLVRHVRPGDVMDAVWGLKQFGA